MSCIWRTIFVHQVIGITMICRQEDGIAVFKGFRHDFRHTLIYRLCCLNSGFPDTGMTNHIGIGKVKANKISTLYLYFRNNGVFQLISAHFRFQVIGRHIFKRSLHDARLSVKRYLTPPGEEEGYMRIFFGLSYSNLLFTSILQYFT
ncbi:hypothetical protein D3C80_937620 [compost metagenome]